MNKKHTIKWFNSFRKNKFLRITKLTFILVLVNVFTLSAKTYSQETLLSVNMRNATIQQVLNEISSQSEFTFAWSNRFVDLNKKVDIRVNRETIDVVLQKLFNGSGIKYKIDGEKVILTPATAKPEAQTQPEKITIQGTVKSATDGSTLPGVSILLKGTTTGTTTDLNGHYSITVPKNGTLIFSFVGFKSQEIPIGNQKTINVNLSSSSVGLNELVVVGYRTSKKSDITGAVSIIKLDKVVDQPISSVNMMLQGQASGVNVLSSASPGGASTLRIRGYSTIRDNDPLYVIDGVPTTSGINMINPNNIKSIQILKDAASASIYGSRAANGVVIITTKKGETGKLNVSFKAYTGIQNVSSLPKNLNAQEYGNVFWDAFKNDGITPSHSIYGNGATPVIPAFLDAEKTIPSANTNWLSEIFHPANTQSYFLSLSKGSKNSHSMFSLGYFNQDGTLKYTGFDRITARLNSDYEILNGKVIIGENLSIAHSGTVATLTNSLLGNVIYNADRMPSIAPVYDINGNFTGYPLSDVQNPVGQLYRNRNNKQYKVRIFGNVFTKINLLKSLMFKSNLGVDYNMSKGSVFSPTYSEPDSRLVTNKLTVNNLLKFNWVWTNTLNYTKTFKKHTFNVLLGVESIENKNEYTTASIQGLPTNNINIRVLNAGDKGTQTNTGDKVESSLFSYFGELNYSYKSKYLFSATLRRDGTSKLLNNRWGTFPALSAGWIISREGFFNKDGVVSNLKLRAGWGKTGNQDIPAYQTISGYSSNPYYSNYAITGSQNSVETGFTLTRIANPDLKWETTTQTDIGVDIGLLNNSISFTADYFIKKTDNLLLFKTLAPDQGITNRGRWQNVGAMQNKGLEFSGNYNSNRSKDFNFNVGFNISFIKNKLLSLGKGINFITTNPAVLHITNFDQPTSRTAVGQPIASFYGYVVDGIFQTDAAAAASDQPNAKAGDFKFKDLNGDGKINDLDRTFLGSPLPDFTYGFNFSATYKNFDFSLFIQGTQGNKIYDLSRYYSDFFDLSNYNKSARILNAWTPQNTNTDIPRISMLDLNNNIRPSSYYVQDGSYIRLKTLQVGYSFPVRLLKKLKASKIRVYLQAYNLLTITKYKGLNPEVGLQNYTSSDRNLDIGVDRGVYPTPKTVSLGIDFNF